MLRSNIIFCDVCCFSASVWFKLVCDYTELKLKVLHEDKFYFTRYVARMYNTVCNPACRQPLLWEFVACVCNEFQPSLWQLISGRHFATTYQDDPSVFDTVEIVSLCLFAAHSAAPIHYRFHHQSLTDCQRSDMISASAAATTQSSWWSVIQTRHNIHIKGVTCWNLVGWCSGAVNVHVIKAQKDGSN